MVLDLFSKRKKRQSVGSGHDVIKYDDLPKKLRVQLTSILSKTLGPWHPTEAWDTDNPISNETWQRLHEALAHEKGLFALDENALNPHHACMNFLLNASVDDSLDILELALQSAEILWAKYGPMYTQESGMTLPANDAIAEVNVRFAESNVGYRFENSNLIRIDSTFMHGEVTTKALSLLSAPGFAGPLDEFLDAHRKYRCGDHKAAIVAALNAFESTMKAICAKRRWAVKPNSTAKDLIAALFDNGLIPTYLSNHVSALRSVLEGGLPALRNKTSGHGQGPTPRSVPDHFVAYSLHLLASNIVFFIECDRVLP